MPKQRLDALLVERSLAESRQQAQRLIQAGAVRINGLVVDKVGQAIELSATIAVAEKPRYVSRGGEKLAKALQTFEIPVSDRICLDGGISTGGFTDCLLQAGAKLIYGIDVGYGQVDWKLRTDDRLVLRERVNLRYLTPAELYGSRFNPGMDSGLDVNPGVEDDREVQDQDPPPVVLYPDLGVVDVSFISLTKVLPALWDLLIPPRELIALVKPQFEVGRDRVGKKGVVRDSQDHANAIVSILEKAWSLGWQIQGLTWSPLTGPAGNIEYLAWLKMPKQDSFSQKSPLGDGTTELSTTNRMAWERSQILTIAQEAKLDLNPG